MTALINKILGLAEYTDAACDINGDGVVNVSDVTAKTPSYPPVRGRPDTETSLEEGTQA